MYSLVVLGNPKKATTKKKVLCFDLLFNPVLNVSVNPVLKVSLSYHKMAPKERNCHVNMIGLKCSKISNVCKIKVSKGLYLCGTTKP